MALKTKAYQGWEEGWKEGGGRASPFSPVMKLGLQENNNVHDIDSSFALSRGRSFGNVRQVASPCPTFRPLLSDFYFSIMLEGLSHRARYRGSGPHPDKRGTASELVMINAPRLYLVLQLESDCFLRTIRALGKKNK